MSKKYIITTAQTGALVHKDFYDNLKFFIKDREIDRAYVFVAKGMYRDDDMIDPRLTADTDIVLVTEGKIVLNENLAIQHSQMPMQAVDPLRGLASKLKSTSYILPGTKIRYKSLPSPYDNPRCLMSTGSVTRPKYKEHTSQGVKAREEHQYGFVFVRVKDNKIFEPVPVTVNKNGSFHFFGNKYENGTKLDSKVDTLVCGDWHVGDTCPIVREKTFEFIKRYKPKYVVLHDFFNGHSINHHEEGDIISKVRGRTEERLSLERELKEALNELKTIAGLNSDTQVVVVNSNHDEWLRTFIKWGKFLNHEGVVIGCALLPKLLDRESVALEEALKIVGTIPKNVLFLNEGESMKRYGVEIGIHGHKGVNGSRGTPAQFKNNNIRAITGHTHVPQQDGNSIVVGTSTKLKLDYNSGGLSGWLNAHAVLYPDGNFHLLTIITK